MRSICLFILLVSGMATAMGQTGPDAKSDPQIEVLKARIEGQQREIDQQRQQVDKRLQEQLDAINRRFEDATAAMNKLLTFLGVFGALSSAFAVTTWFKGRSDYLNERKGQEALVGQQVDMGKKLMAHSDDVVKYQIESIGKLRDVIGFVAESFSLQVDREKGLKEFTDLAADLNEHYKASYARAREGILSLKVSRMGWATLPLAEYRIAERARAEFHTIPDRYLRMEAEQRPLEFAAVCQRIGTSAFYANDIDYGRELLAKAWTIFQKYEDERSGFPDDYLMARIAAAFFLGLIAKSWIGESQTPEQSLGEAKKWLVAAADLLRRNERRAQRDVQIPITLAEVLSYIDGTRAEAREILGTPEETSGPAIIPRLQSTTDRDENQQKLLSRACLIRGNLEHDRSKPAAPFYEAALRHDPKNAYAILSLALATNEPTKRAVLFRDGSEALRPHLEKQELTAVALARAWAAIAAHELGDPATAAVYSKSLEGIRASGAANAGGKQPLFFDPISKRLARLEDLIEAITTYLHPAADKAIAGS
jgi:hypothetical protein